jgi:two-component system OmpR family sensor kinase
VGVVLVGESRHLVDVTLRATRRLLLLAAAGAALASLVGGWWLTGRALGPVAEVTRVARRIAATGQFEQRLAVPPARDELGELTATFNEMLARLEKTFDHQREFLADVSHELRGPLMVIRGNLDLLKLDLPDGERQESAREATEELERMTRLVADLLFLAEVDAQEMVHHEPVALHEVVSEVWTRARELDAGAHELVVDRNDPLTVRGDRHWLGQVLWNLVENALRYTPAGGRVTLALSRHGPVAELMVADTGPGIAAEHLPRLFERFYRVDRTRSRQQGGTGLGLAIVQQVVQAHGGQVRVRSQPGEGSTFTIALPVESP